MAETDIPLTLDRDDVPAPRRRDRGFTFVETVITVVLMGVVIVPILATVRSAVRVSAVSESAAEVETVLINAADRIQRASTSSCDLSADVALAVPSGWPASSISITQQYLDVNVKAWLTGAPTPMGRGPACPSAGLDADKLVKRVTITVTSPDGRIRRQMQVVKSNV